MNTDDVLGFYSAFITDPYYIPDSFKTRTTDGRWFDKKTSVMGTGKETWQIYWKTAKKTLIIEEVLPGDLFVSYRILDAVPEEVRWESRLFDPQLEV